MKKKSNLNPSIIIANLKKVMPPLRPDGKIMTEILALITLKWRTKAPGAMLPTLREAQKQPKWTILTAETANYTYKELPAVIDCFTADFIPVLWCDAASLVPTLMGDLSSTRWHPSTHAVIHLPSTFAVSRLVFSLFLSLLTSGSTASSIFPLTFGMMATKGRPRPRAPPPVLEYLLWLHRR